MQRQSQCNNGSIENESWNPGLQPAPNTEKYSFKNMKAYNKNIKNNTTLPITDIFFRKLQKLQQKNCLHNHIKKLKFF